MDDFKANAIAIGIRELFTSRSFSICQFNKLEEIMGARVSADLRKQLELLHCVDYSEMPPDFRQQLYRKVAESLGVPDVPDVEITDDGIKIIEPPKIGWLGRMKQSLLGDSNE